MAKRNGIAAVAEEAPAEAVSPEDIDYGLGMFEMRFREPKEVGTIAALECTQLKTRAKLIEKKKELINDLTVELQLLVNEQMGFARSFGSRFGLGPRDTLNVNDDTGVVTHTGKGMFVRPAPEPEAPPVEVAEETNSAAGDAPVN